MNETLEALARYDGLLLAIPNATVLLAPLTTQEAVLSSRIEGTQATMGEVLRFEAGAELDPADPAKAADIRQILDLYQQKKQWTVGTTHSQHAIVALDFIFSHPIFRSTHFIESTKIPEATARRILKLCQSMGSVVPPFTKVQNDRNVK